jgi:molybdenum cofactor synthesis domain-containing protein
VSDPATEATPRRRSAIVVTASDRSAEGSREDTSGNAVATRLEQLGLTVERMVVPDDQSRIEATLVAAATRHHLVVTTGGTGLTPRDVTPQATLAVIDYEVPGLAELMRAEGRRHTPMAALSRAVVGVLSGSLIVNLPGSPKGATESLEALVPVLEHALETLAGPFDHAAARGAGRDDLPPTEPPAAGGNPGVASSR